MRVTVRKKLSEADIPVVIETEFIKLEGFVTVNGEVCTMRGKKLYPGDRFCYEGQSYLISIHAAQ